MSPNLLIQFYFAIRQPASNLILASLNGINASTVEAQLNQFLSSPDRQLAVARCRLPEAILACLSNPLILSVKVTHAARNPTTSETAETVLRAIDEAIEALSAG